MADNQITSTVEALFKGINGLVTTKTVVGDAVKVEDTIIVPLVDVSCGMGASGFNGSSGKDGKVGGMSAKISPSAILVIQNGVTKLVNIKQQDAFTKVMDLVPDLVNKFAGGGHDISPEAVKVAEEMAANSEEKTTVEKV